MRGVGLSVKATLNAVLWCCLGVVIAMCVWG